MEASPEVKRYVGHPLLVGASAGLLTALLIGNRGTVSVFGMQLSPAWAVGTAAAAGDLVNQYTADKLEPMMGEYSDVQKKAVGPVVTGLATLGMVSLLIGKPRDTNSAAVFFGIGAGGNYIGNMAAETSSLAY